MSADDPEPFTIVKLVSSGVTPFDTLLKSNPEFVIPSPIPSTVTPFELLPVLPSISIMKFWG